MKKYNDIDEKLSRILDDLLIASEHIEDALPDMWSAYGKDFCLYDILYSVKNSIDEHYNTVYGIRERRKIIDGR